MKTKILSKEDLLKVSLDTKLFGITMISRLDWLIYREVMSSVYGFSTPMDEKKSPLFGLFTEPTCWSSILATKKINERKQQKCELKARGGTWEKGESDKQW